MDETTEGRSHVAGGYRICGEMLAQLLARFHGVRGRWLLAVDVLGLLSEAGQKNVETIALNQGVAPRTFQRRLEMVRWNQRDVLRKCHKIIAQEHPDLNATGVIGEAELSCNEIGCTRLLVYGVSHVGLPAETTGDHDFNWLAVDVKQVGRGPIAAQPLWGRQDNERDPLTDARKSTTSKTFARRLGVHRLLTRHLCPIEQAS